MNGLSVEWVSSWKYLGLVVSTGSSFSCSIEEHLHKFYKCANAMFRVEGQSRELTMPRLVESHCVPILTYAIEVVKCPVREQWKLRVAYNSVFRRIFGFRRFNSVRELQQFLVRPTWEELVEARAESFTRKLKYCNNKIVNLLSVRQ
jgi:hypothetical protein